MDSELKRRLESGLTAVFAERGLTDGLAAYRSVLRDLRARDSEAFRQAAEHYETEVVPRLAGGEDPVEVWVDYGTVIGGLTARGRMMVIDETGRAAPFMVPLEAGSVVLYVPESGRLGAFVAISPVEPSPAQQATIGLLAEGRLGL